MRKKLLPGLLPLFILFFSCHTITSNRTKMGIPSSQVYFSFDDGPDVQDDTTARLLDVLKKYQIQAFFCLLGENAEQYPDLVKRIHAEGHYLINHGYADKHASKMNDVEFRDNLMRGEAAISASLGFDMHPRLYRPHGGFYHSNQEKICIDEGYTIVYANIRIYDAVKSGSQQHKVVQQTIKKLEKQGGGIILLHDARGSYSRKTAEVEKHPNCAYNRSWIPETVEQIILMLLEKGYTLDNPNALTAIGLDE